MLNPIISCMRDELLAGSYIQADETPVDVQMHDKRSKNHQAYLWQFGSPGKSVVFKFNMGREGKAAELFLGDFNGLLQTDGYAGYNHAGGPSMVHAFCNSHSRRLFVGAVKVYLLEVLPGLLNRSIKSVAQLTPAAYLAKRAK
jgi:hypothetical protein